MHAHIAGRERTGQRDGGVVGARNVEEDGVAQIEWRRVCVGVADVKPVREPVRGRGRVPDISRRAAPDEFGVGDGRRRRRRHLVAEKIIHVARLVITFAGALDAVGGVLHQAVQAVRRRNFRGVNAQLGIVVGDEDDFLAPVAEDVAPERGASAVLLMHAFVVDRIDAARRAGVGIKLVDDGIQRAAARAVFEFAGKVGVPPDGFGRPDVVRVNLISLAVEDARLRGIKFQPAMVWIQVERRAAAHIGDAGGIPFLDDRTAAHVNERRGEQGGIVLLDGKHFQSRPVGVNVRDVEAVAVDEFGVKKRLAVHAVQDRADIDQIVNAVVVHVHDADLVAPGFIRVVGRRVKPAARQCWPHRHGVAIIIGHRLALERLRRVAVFTMNQHAGMHAVAIHDAEMAAHRTVRRPQVRDDGPRHFMAGQAVNDGKVLRDVIRRGGDCAVAEHHALGRADDHFGFAVAVEVVHGDVVAVTDADGRRAGFDGVLVDAVVAHIHLPEKCAVALVGLQILVGRHCRGKPVHEVIVFTIAVQISDPAKLHIVRRRSTADDRVQRQGQILAHRRIGRLAGRRAGCLFHATDDRHDVPGVRQSKVRGGVQEVRGVRERLRI